VLSPRKVHNHFPNWRAYREYSGGGLTDMGAHHFDIAQWALGMDASGPVEVIPPSEAKDVVGARLVFASGVEVIHGGPSGCTFEGTAGKLYIDRGRLTSEPESIVKTPLADKEVHLFRSPGHHRNWLDCIRSRQRPVADVEIGARSVTMCHLINLAYWYRRKLRFDPVQWAILDDTEAGQWVDRPRRDPWQLPAV
jgi:predicted dehydrogenase